MLDGDLSTYTPYRWSVVLLLGGGWFYAGEGALSPRTHRTRSRVTELAPPFVYTHCCATAGIPTAERRPFDPFDQHFWMRSSRTLCRSTIATVSHQSRHQSRWAICRSLRHVVRARQRAGVWTARTTRPRLHLLLASTASRIGCAPSLLPSSSSAQRSALSVEGSPIVSGDGLLLCIRGLSPR